MIQLPPGDDIATGRVWATLRRSPGFWIGAPIVAFFLFIAVLPGPIAGLFGHGDPRVCELSLSRDAPDWSTGHPFGFTVQGCDLYASVVHGARASIVVGVTVTVLTSVVAVVLGILAGYFGGIVDAIVSRLSEIVFALPLLLGAIVVLNSIQGRSVWMLSLVLAVFAWPTAMRVTRGEALSIRNRHFIVAARSSGIGTFRILVTHVLPNTVGPVIVLATLQIGAVISAEATLTYLGIGLQPPAQSWGLQLSAAQNYFQTAPHLLVYPAAVLTLAVAGFVVLGESVRQATTADRGAA